MHEEIIRSYKNVTQKCKEMNKCLKEHENNHALNTVLNVYTFLQNYKRRKMTTLGT